MELCCPGGAVGGGTSQSRAGSLSQFYENMIKFPKVNQIKSRSSQNKKTTCVAFMTVHPANKHKWYFHTRSKIKFWCNSHM